MEALFRTGVTYDFEEAMDWVKAELVSRIQASQELTPLQPLKKNTHIQVTTNQPNTMLIMLDPKGGNHRHKKLLLGLGGFLKYPDFFA